jgi:hypothetical protein
VLTNNLLAVEAHCRQHKTPATGPLPKYHALRR